MHPTQPVSFYVNTSLDDAAAFTRDRFLVDKAKALFRSGAPQAALHLTNSIRNDWLRTETQDYIRERMHTVTMRIHGMGARM